MSTPPQDDAVARTFAAPTWFGPAHRPRLGWLHVPTTGLASVGVVLCPSVGVEATSSSIGLRRLGAQLATDGAAVLRVDYDGTGDSSGSMADPDRVDAWTATVEAAAALLGATGLPVVLVGLRLGALVVTEAAARGLAPDGVVLWDPYPTGRAFLRRQRLLRTVLDLGTPVGDGAVEGPGVVFGPDVVADLGRLSLERLPASLRGRALVLHRAGQAPDATTCAAVDAVDAELAPVTGQESLTDVEPVHAVVHQPDLDLVRRWVRERALREPVSVDLRPEPSTVVPVATGTDPAVPVAERFVRTGRHALLTVVTDPVRGAATDTAVVVFLNAGVIDHTGPARLWVEWGRRWAAAGLRTVRLDIPGVGETPARPGQAGAPSLAPGTLDDLASLVEEVRPGPTAPLVLVGLCSGGALALELALRVGASGAVTVNPNVLPDTVPRDAAQVRLTAPATRSWARHLPFHNAATAVVERLPWPAWWVLNRVAVHHPPGITVRRVAATGTRLFVATNAHEAARIERGEVRALRRLRAAGDLTLVVDSRIDHTLFCADGRQVVASEADRFVRAHFVDRSGPAPGRPTETAATTPRTRTGAHHTAR
jgi:alpha-beta hydrolase superfamily lysophospholipase